MIDIRDLKITYGTRFELDIPHLVLKPGVLYGLVGANGAGKTTLLQALAVRLKPSDDPSALGFLPQKPFAFSVSVRHNIELGIPRSARLTKEERFRQVNHQLTALGIESLAAQRADRLSGGEVQKMALARLLVMPRRILLLDEPTTSMDRQSLQSASQAIRQYQTKHASLMVLVSHQIPLLRQLTDELVFLDRGRLVEQGPTRELLDQSEQSTLQRLFRDPMTGEPPDLDALEGDNTPCCMS